MNMRNYPEIYKFVAYDLTCVYAIIRDHLTNSDKFKIAKVYPSTDVKIIEIGKFLNFIYIYSSISRSEKLK